MLLTGCWILAIRAEDNEDERVRRVESKITRETEGKRFLGLF